MDKKKKVVKCNECWREFEIEDNEEWGYCPFCENDQVEATNCNLYEDWGSSYGTRNVGVKTKTITSVKGKNTNDNNSS